MTPEQLASVEKYKLDLETADPNFLARHRKRLKLFHEQEGLCCICEAKMLLVFKPSYHNHATFEHVIPASKGGSNRVKNTPLSCRRCNQYRGDMEFEEFKAKVRQVGVTKLKYLRSSKKPLSVKQQAYNAAYNGDEAGYEYLLSEKLAAILFIQAIEEGWRSDFGGKTLDNIRKHAEKPLEIVKFR